MEIKTKFNINDELWFIDTKLGKAVKRKVIGMHFQQYSREKHIADPNGTKGLVGTGDFLPDNLVINYHFKDYMGQVIGAPEEKLFQTKEELLASL